VNLKPEIQDKLTGIAKSVGLELEFVEGLPVRFYGCQHVEVPLAVINSDQPQCEQIFTILHEIAHYELHCKRAFTIKTPFFLNVAYENQKAAEIAYTTKRMLRQKFGREWQADGWALTAYSLLGFPKDLADFLERHPRKILFMPLVLPILLRLIIVSRFKQVVSSFVPARTKE